MSEHPLSGVSDLVGTRVRELRSGQRMTVEALAARCADAGAPHLTGPAIYAVESGRKEKGTNRRRRLISVDEVLVLAYVLGVKPDALLVPPDIADDEPYRLTPGLTAPAGAIRRWLRGESGGVIALQGEVRVMDVPERNAAAVRRAFESNPDEFADLLRALDEHELKTLRTGGEDA